MLQRQDTAPLSRNVSFRLLLCYDIDMKPTNQEHARILQRTAFASVSADGPSGLAPRQQRLRRRRGWAAVALGLTVMLALAIEAFPRLFDAPWNREIPPVTGLHPVVAAKQAELEAAARQAGIEILVTDGFRSKEEQDALYRRGRTEPGSVVTKVKGGDSYHNYGLAIDFALRTKDGKVVWDMKLDGNRNGTSDWTEVVAIAKQLGFTWGGDWTSFPDYPHLQMDFGYSIRELKRGKLPPADQP